MKSIRQQTKGQKTKASQTQGPVCFMVSGKYEKLSEDEKNKIEQVNSV